MQMNKDEIKKMLKHRDPFLFIDGVSSILENKIEAYFDMTKDYIVFDGHFPNEPIVPGVLLIETLAQTSGVHIVSKILKEKKLRMEDVKYDSFIIKINNFKFKETIIPDARLVIKAEIEPTSMENYYEAKGQIYVNNKVKAFGNLVLYVKYALIEKQ